MNRPTLVPLAATRMLPAAAALALGLFATPALADAGKVTYLEGSASRSAPGGEELELEVDSAVLEGDAIQTGKDGRLEITLADGSVLRLAESGRVIIHEVAQPAGKGWQVQLKLTLGSIWAQVAKRATGEPGFEVHTDRVVAGVRGTQFVVDAQQDHSVVVLEGQVNVADPDGKNLGDRPMHEVTAMKAIRVGEGGRTEGVTGIDGKHDFSSLIKWVRKFEFDKSKGGKLGKGGKAERGHKRGTWIERREQRKVEHRENRKVNRLFGR